MTLQQRQVLYLTAAVAAISLLARPAFPPIDIIDGKFVYRGFTVDVSAVHNLRFSAGSLRNQIDLVADSGVDLHILDFFRGRRITLKSDMGDQPGRFVPGKGIELNSALQFTDAPVLLHELLHVLHALMLPLGFHNPEVLRFYLNARSCRSHSASAYAMSDVKEFFAVTASTYLCGAADRVPFTRETLEARQPHYCDWLYELFGV